MLADLRLLVLSVLAGIDEVDYDLYPDKAYQLTWLRRYLEFESTAKGRSPSEVTELDVERFYVQVNKCACVSDGMVDVCGDCGF